MYKGIACPKKILMQGGLFWDRAAGHCSRHNEEIRSPQVDVFCKSDRVVEYKAGRLP